MQKWEKEGVSDKNGSERKSLTCPPKFCEGGLCFILAKPSLREKYSKTCQPKIEAGYPVIIENELMYIYGF